MSHTILLPLVAAGAVLALIVVVAALLMRDGKRAQRRVEALFRKPLSSPTKPGADHYYKPYWS
jgi:predicted PurR-regulated permease PerM